MLRIPRHYQVDGITWLTEPNVKLNHDDLFPTLSRHLLTDAPGAGKSFQATEAANKLVPAHQSIVIIAPAHLCKQWFDFIGEQYPDDTIIWFEGTMQNKQRDLTKRARWAIISTQSFRREKHVEMYTQLFIKWLVFCVILDESHYCKNRDALQSNAIRKITRPGFVPHLIALSATPIMREADDLYMQLRILDPITFHKFDLFLNTYCWFSWTSWGAQDVSLRKDAPDALKNWMMGRSYKDIGLELPLVISNIHAHNMIPARRKAYDNIKKFWYTLISEDNVKHDASGEPVLTANNAMEVMHMLRHIISSPEKQEDLSQFLQDDPGPYLIAVFYRDSGKELAAYLKQHHPHLNPILISGEIPADERIKQASNSKNKNDVVIATIPSISEGVDLSHCNTVYFYEESYTPGSMYQFLSRVRRHRNVELSITQAEPTPAMQEWRKERGLPTDMMIVDHLDITDPNDHPIIVRYFHAEKSIDQHIHNVQTQRSVNIRDLIKVELGA